ncbi:hypothetical protein AUQ37_02720 [Candidatus Methanomethylophilus sp. 1R26]|nr:hypothetical protein [Candidatus Methanomethylophilus sp. 1R26]KUE73359.1 hypothetical protein AUQ37_02720 [Candidatus Methanomethylophilus sp. 1R26]
MSNIFRSDCRATALAAVLLIALAAFAGAAVSAAESDAASDPTYGTATDINIAPGMRYTWTSQWPSDLNPTCTIEVQKSGSLTGSDVSIATISGKTLTVNIPSNAAVGTTYHVVEKATTTNPAQTAYVYIIFHVVAKLSVSVSAPNVVAGGAVSISPDRFRYGDRDVVRDRHALLAVHQLEHRQDHRHRPLIRHQCELHAHCDIQLRRDRHPDGLLQSRFRTGPD